MNTSSDDIIAGIKEDVREIRESLRDTVNEVRSVREAIIPAIGHDGKNGKLSDVRTDLKNLRSTLWSGLVAIVLGYGLVAINACVDANNRATRDDERIKTLIKAQDDLETRFRVAHPSYSPIYERP